MHIRGTPSLFVILILFCLTALVNNECADYNVSQPLCPLKTTCHSKTPDCFSKQACFYLLERMPVLKRLSHNTKPLSVPLLLLLRQQASFSFAVQSFHSCSSCSSVTWGERPGRTSPPTVWFLCAVMFPSFLQETFVKVRFEGKQVLFLQHQYLPQSDKSKHKSCILPAEDIYLQTVVSTCCSQHGQNHRDSVISVLGVGALLHWCVFSHLFAPELSSSLNSTCASIHLLQSGDSVTDDTVNIRTINA